MGTIFRHCVIRSLYYSSASTLRKMEIDPQNTACGGAMKNGHRVTHAIFSPHEMHLSMYSCIYRVTPRVLTGWSFIFIALFSASEQTHCALVAYDSE